MLETSFCWIKTGVLAFGALKLAVTLVNFFTFLYNNFVKGSTLKSYQKPGSWAIVTGATDGIGKAFTLELANKGFNVLLISRSEERLNDVITKDLKDSPVESDHLAIDFSKTTKADYEKLKEKIKGRDIAVLVNNVGAGYPHPEFFNELPEDEVIDHIVRLNIDSVNRVTKTVLPTMIEQKRGLVLTLSSASSILPTCPLLSVYAASKYYTNLWSTSLNVEYANKGIRFECLAPFYITSKLSKMRKASLLVPNPTTYVKSAVSTIGAATLRCGYFPHELIIFVVSLMPSFIANKYILGQNLAIRARALKKK